MIFNPAHPGEVLRDYLGEMTVAEAATRLGVTRAHLSRILNGRAGVSAAVTTIAVEPRKKTVRTVDDRGASQTVARRSTTSYPATAAVEAVLPRQADSRVDARPDTQRSSACTEAVAALGLCNPGTTGESK